jgi:hypothetical protein
MKAKIFLMLLFLSSPCFAAEAVPSVHSLNAHTLVITTNPTLNLYWITVTWETQAQRRLIIYDSTAALGDTILDSSKILYCGILSNTNDPAPGSKSFDWSNHPLQHGKLGMVALISTSDLCTTLTNDGDHNWITAGFN